MSYLTNRYVGELKNMFCPYSLRMACAIAQPVKIVWARHHTLDASVSIQFLKVVITIKL